MEPSLESLVAESKNRDLWLAISQNLIDDAQKTIAAKCPPNNKSFFSFLKATVVTPDQAMLQLASDILSGKKRKPLSSLQLTIKENGEEYFAELIRFLFALHHNGRYIPEVTLLSNEIFTLLKKLTKQIQVGADGYPGKSIAGYVWGSGFVIRQWCNPLAELFEKAGDLAGKANTLQNRSMITAAIMSHYPHTLGHDMIETAMALEAVGEIDIPKTYYNAIISDFQRIADDIKANPEEQVMEDEIISLVALKQSYENLNRINKVNLHTEELMLIASIIERGATYVPPTDEESDD